MHRPRLEINEILCHADDLQGHEHRATDLTEPRSIRFSYLVTKMNCYCFSCMQHDVPRTIERSQHLCRTVPRIQIRNQKIPVPQVLSSLHEQTHCSFSYSIRLPLEHTFFRGL